MRRLLVAAPALLCMSLFTEAISQSSNATLSGTVSDAAKAFIPGATITVTNEETNVKREVSTTADGFYSVAGLPPGLYTVVAQSAGFAPANLTHVQVSAETTFDIDIIDLPRLRAEVRRITTGAHARLLKAGRVARTVVIKLRHTDMHTVTRSETISAPTDDLAELAATAERLLLDPAEFGGIRLAGVAFSGLSVPHQDALFSLAVPETVAATVVSPAPAASPSTWRQGDDVVHAEFGTGWVQGAGHGRVTVRFETRDSGPGAARTFDQDDRELKRGEPTDCLG